MINLTFDLFALDPAAMIYAFQGSTYGVAAVLARRAGHIALASCYGVSAILHGLLFAIYL